MQRKILIVDDELDVLTILEKKLRENDFFVTAVSKGKDAVTFARLDKPDLILLDIILPDLDGYSVASLIREDKDLKDVPIIFLTGKPLETKGIHDRLLELGACDYLTKPCEFKDILAKIKGFLI